MAQTLQEKLDEPVGLSYDMLYEIRRAMRILRRCEKRIITAHKAEKRRRAKSNEWREAKRLRDEIVPPVGEDTPEPELGMA